MKFVDIQFNGTFASAFGIYIKNKLIPASQELVQELAVPGKDGNLIVRKGTYESTQIQVNFNYVGEKWGEIWRNVKHWLAVTDAEMFFSDDSDIFYKISHVVVGKISKQGNYIREFSATFVTKDGLSYLQSGKNEYDLTETFTNPGITSKPIYKITGVGLCILTVNGVDVIANVLGDIVIDTEKMIAYRSDGISQNTAISGDYENLYLKAGENSLSVTEGFECKIIPRWRCL